MNSYVLLRAKQRYSPKLRPSRLNLMFSCLIRPWTCLFALTSKSSTKTPEELAVLQRMVDWLYGEFIAKVAEGRGLAPDKVEAIAQGRVWSGMEAQKLGLVDELGGLDDAIAFAAEKAGLGAGYRLQEYPRQKELMEVIQDLIDKASQRSVRAPGLAAKIAERIETEMKTLRALNDPQGLYARLPYSLQIR